MSAGNNASKAVVIADSWPGVSVDLLSPKVSDIDFPALSRRLSRLARFVGGTRDFYSVAQHSVVVCDLVSPAARPYALLHDAHEGFFGALTSPLRQALDALMQPYRRDEHTSMDMAALAIRNLSFTWDYTIFLAAGFEFPSFEIQREVIEMDSRVTEAELRALVYGTPHPLLGPRFEAQAMEAAEIAFMQALRVICPATAPAVSAALNLHPRHR